jgi:hypothetical protein
MKIIRVPWIRCRADELGAAPWDLEWRGREISVLAYSESEALGWWRGLSDSEREELLGVNSQPSGDGALLF